MIKFKEKSIILLMCLFSLLSLLLISCEEELGQSGELSLTDKIALNEENVLLHDFANILAKSLSSENGKAFIKEKALEEFDGDYDILVAKAKDERLNETSLKNSGYETFGNFLESFFNEDCKTKSKEDFDLFIASLLEEYPLLQISIPEIYEQSTEAWDIASYTPLVAVLPANFDETMTKVITAYDLEGNISYLNINEYPKSPVIVIGENERLIAFSKDQKNTKPSQMRIEDPCLELYYETPSYDYYMPIDCGGSSGGNSGGNSGGAITYDRDINSSKDNLYKARFQSKDAFRQIEAWPNGRPEFKVVITYIEKVGSSYETRTISKILTKSDWLTRYVLWCDLKTKHINLPVITWDKEKYGTTMKYTWIEQDASDSKTEFTIATSSNFGENDDVQVNGSVSITISVKDDEAGESIVEYMDKTTGDGTEYKTGIVKFWINQ